VSSPSWWGQLEGWHVMIYHRKPDSGL
jgi:hypothetical protein